MKMKYIIGCGVFLLLLTACSVSKKRERERIITVTIEPQRYFTEAVAGDKFTVISMVPKGNNPETYDPTPKQLMELSKSEAYFRIGYIGFELAWMDRLLDNVPHIRVFDTSKGVRFIGDTTHKSSLKNNVEPHIWCSPVNARMIARNTFDALCALDRENQPYYLSRYDSLCRRIERTDSIIRGILEEKTDRAFLIYHPTLSYYARDYGLSQICIEKDGKEPSPAHLKRLIERCKAERIHVIFIQPEFDSHNAEAIAKETNTTLFPMNPLSSNWEKEMIQVAEKLTKSVVHL